MNIKETIGKMTLQEKAAILTGKDFWQTLDFEALGIKSIFLSDGPHGLRKQAAAADHLGLNQSIPATCFPTAATMANSWNEELGEEMGEALGDEAKALGANVLLGPGVCMKRNPRCGRNFEYFSEDPYIAGKMASAYIRGIQKNGTAACVKHFACNNQELRRMSSDSVLDERTFREIYLEAFEMAVKEGKTESIMSSYNKINGVYAHENYHLLQEILRDEWGFDGTVISDWGGSNDRVESIKAGGDLEMPSCKYGVDEIVKAVKEGKLEEAAVDKCVERVLTLIERTTKGESTGKFDVEAHHALALKCAEESVVLLENNGVLPLKEGVKVAIIGDYVDSPRYQGAGSSIVNPTKLDKTSEIIKDYALNVVGTEKGFDRYGKKNDGLKKKAVKLAEKADVAILFLGLDEVTEAEGLDREHISFPENQISLYRAVRAVCPNVVIVLSCGSAVEIEWAKGADALVYGCLGGQAGARAQLDIITGKVNPSGKLTETFPAKYESCPTAAYFPGEKLTAEYREGLYIGYRYYDTVGVKVSYPFGYGLSYTKFEYSDLKVNDEGVALTVKNVGEVAGKEAVQLYIGKEDGEIFRPKKELKGFKKVSLKPGESKEVHIPFDDKSFRYFNVKTNKFEIEEGTYQIYIGASVEDIRLKGELFVKGTAAPNPYTKEDLPSYYTGRITHVSDEEFEKLIGRPIPQSEYAFYKKNRMIIDENATVSDLRYAPGWVGRLFSSLMRFAVWFMKAIGNRTMANTLVMGVIHQPVRGLAKFGGMGRNKLDGMITIFNGHFFKGLGLFFKSEEDSEKEAKKQNKEQLKIEKKEETENKKEN